MRARFRSLARFACLVPASLPLSPASLSCLSLSLLPLSSLSASQAEQRRQELLRKTEEEERQARGEAHRIKKEMAAQTKLEREKEEARQAKVKEVSLEQRKKNDEYDKWLSTDHIRTIAEQAHERKDPSKMHEGAKFSGIPTDFTPGI